MYTPIGLRSLWWTPIGLCSLGSDKNGVVRGKRSVEDRDCIARNEAPQRVSHKRDAHEAGMGTHNASDLQQQEKEAVHKLNEPAKTLLLKASKPVETRKLLCKILQHLLKRSSPTECSTRCRCS